MYIYIYIYIYVYIYIQCCGKVWNNREIIYSLEKLHTMQRKMIRCVTFIQI